MPYDYQSERPNIFTEAGVELLIEIRDSARNLLRCDAGVVRQQEVIRPSSADEWTVSACFDYLVERGELREIDEAGCGLGRTFAAGWKWKERPS